uniref:Uncharacterized protein n=1 Tax=Vespula pensylvanica TaxID=30213 RepID=A0A834P750_VESPE|nr:hypothetical protein H0235_004362 [Vespula pensylvanica]
MKKSLSVLESVQKIEVDLHILDKNAVLSECQFVPNIEIKTYGTQRLCNYLVEFLVIDKKNEATQGTNLKVEPDIHDNILDNILERCNRNEAMGAKRENNRDIVKVKVSNDEVKSGYILSLNLDDAIYADETIVSNMNGQANIKILTTNEKEAKITIPVVRLEEFETTDGHDASRCRDDARAAETQLIPPNMRKYVLVTPLSITGVNTIAPISEMESFEMITTDNDKGVPGYLFRWIVRTSTGHLLLLPSIDAAVGLPPNMVYVLTVLTYCVRIIGFGSLLILKNERSRRMRSLQGLFRSGFAVPF